jgi:hypothetical protein
MVTAGGRRKKAQRERSEGEGVTEGGGRGSAGGLACFAGDLMTRRGCAGINGRGRSISGPAWREQIGIALTATESLQRVVGNEMK